MSYEIRDGDVYRAAFRKSELELAALRSQVDRLTGEVALWKEGCERNADLYKSSVRAQDNYRLDLKRYKEALDKARVLLSMISKYKPTFQPISDVEYIASVSGHTLTSINGLLDKKG